MARGCSTCFEVFKDRTDEDGATILFCPHDGTPTVLVCCPECGYGGLNDEGLYCIHCGAKLDYKNIVNEALGKVVT